MKQVVLGYLYEKVGRPGDGGTTWLRTGCRLADDERPLTDTPTWCGESDDERAWVYICVEFYDDVDMKTMEDGMHSLAPVADETFRKGHPGRALEPHESH